MTKELHMNDCDKIIVLSEGTPLALILSEAKPPFHLSQFMHTLKIDSKVYVFNTFTNALISVPRKEWDRLIKNPNDESLSRLTDILNKYRYLVSDAINEVDRYLEIFKFLKDRDLNNSKICRYNILTTTGCNLRCFYCFENGIQHYSMDDNTIENVCQFILKTYDKNDPIHLRWFGGEPLLNHRAISKICLRLKEEEVPFYSTMSSNGVLFNPDLQSKAVNVWNLRKIRVSLDGYGEEHDKRKGIVSGSSVFDKLIDNLCYTIGSNLQVNIRLTVDGNNVDSMLGLMEYLLDKLKDNRNITFYTRCIFDSVDSNAIKKDEGKVKTLIEKVRALDQWMIEKGVYDMSRIAPIGLRKHYCAANDPKAIVIDPQGRLCGCESIDATSTFWGDVVNGITDETERQRWIGYNDSIKEKCANCKFLPVCTPFDCCPIDYYDCNDKLEYVHNLHIARIVTIMNNSGFRML